MRYEDVISEIAKLERQRKLVESAPISAIVRAKLLGDCDRMVAQLEDAIKAEMEGAVQAPQGAQARPK